jgi:hypothetical protein
MTTTINGAKQMEMTVKIGQLLITKETKLRAIKGIKEAKRCITFLEDEIQDLRYIINSNCTTYAIKEVLRGTLSKDIKSIVSPYIGGK